MRSKSFVFDLHEIHNELFLALMPARLAVGAQMGIGINHISKQFVGYSIVPTRRWIPPAFRIEPIGTMSAEDAPVAVTLRGHDVFDRPKQEDYQCSIRTPSFDLMNTEGEMGRMHDDPLAIAQEAPEG